MAMLAANFNVFRILRILKDGYCVAALTERLTEVSLKPVDWIADNLSAIGVIVMG